MRSSSVVAFALHTMTTSRAPRMTNQHIHSRIHRKPSNQGGRQSSESAPPTTPSGILAPSYRPGPTKHTRIVTMRLSCTAHPRAHQIALKTATVLKVSSLMHSFSS